MVMATLDIGNTTSPNFSYYPTLESRSNPSSPSLCLEKFLSLQKNEERTQPSQSQNVYAVVLVNGQPIVIGQKAKPEPAIEISQNDTETQPTVSLNQRLDLIKSRLSLSITQLADLFGVTRKAIYDWYEGAEPRRIMMSRIEILIDVLETVPPEVDLRRLKALWNIPISGKSFRAVFDDEDIASLRTVLAEKLNELSPRMVATTSSMRKTATHFGEAHLAEVDRRTDIR